MTGLVIYMNGERGLMTLKRVLEHGYKISAIVVPLNSNIKANLESNKITRTLKVLEVSNCNEKDFIDYISFLEPSMAIVAGFPQILSDELVSLPELGTINQHGGKLPQYRGGSPLNWQIINGESIIGVSIIKMDSGIDTGALIYEDSFSLKDNEDISDAHRKANEIFADLSLRALQALEEGSVELIEQNDTDAVYWHQRNSDDGLINWNTMNAQQVINMVRALTRPYPGAYTFRNGDRINIFSASFPSIVIKGVPGRVCYVQGQGPFVVCSDMAILLHDYVIRDNQQKPIGMQKLRRGDRLKEY